jgi:hypothetical protein
VSIFFRICKRWCKHICSREVLLKTLAWIRSSPPYWVQNGSSFYKGLFSFQHMTGTDK